MLSLSQSDRDLIFPHLKKVTVPHETIIFKAEDTIGQVYFPHRESFRSSWVGTLPWPEPLFMRLPRDAQLGKHERQCLPAWTNCDCDFQISIG
jgi:hypothetical protein